MLLGSTGVLEGTCCMAAPQLLRAVLLDSTAALDGSTASLEGSVAGQHSRPLGHMLLGNKAAHEDNVAEQHRIP